MCKKTHVQRHPHDDTKVHVFHLLWLSVYDITRCPVGVCEDEECKDDKRQMMLDHTKYFVTSKTCIAHVQDCTHLQSTRTIHICIYTN